MIRVYRRVFECTRCHGKRRVRSLAVNKATRKAKGWGPGHKKRLVCTICRAVTVHVQVSR